MSRKGGGLRLAFGRQGETEKDHITGNARGRKNFSRLQESALGLG